jgi:hypothetical protein
MALIDRMKLRIVPLPAVATDALLQEMIDSAGETILAYTGRSTLPDALVGAQLDLAVIRFNQLGVEGESSHSEGGVSRSISDIPDNIRRILNPWRLARTVY